MTIIKRRDFYQFPNYLRLTKLNSDSYFKKRVPINLRKNYVKYVKLKNLHVNYQNVIYIPIP